MFPAGSAWASLVARYRTWLGLAAFVAPTIEAVRLQKVEGEDLVVGKSVDLLVLACKSNALRCRLLGSTPRWLTALSVKEKDARLKRAAEDRHLALGGDPRQLRRRGFFGRWKRANECHLGVR